MQPFRVHQGKVAPLDRANVDALKNRALAYRAKGDYDHEIADSSEAKRLEAAGAR